MKDYSSFYNKVFFEEIGVYFSNLSLRAQLWFYEYIKKSNPEEKERALTFAKRFGEDGVKTFIAIEQDGGAGESIFAVADSRIVDSTKRRVFRVYAELVDSAEGLRGYLLSNFKNKVFDNDSINKMIANLLLKAGRLVTDFADKIGSESENNDEQIDLAVAQKLDEINVKVLVFADVLKYLPREEVSNLDLKEIPVIEKIEDISGVELSGRTDLVEKMKAIIRKQFPDGDDIEFEKEIADNSNIRFTVVLVEGEIISFFAKKKIGEKIDYVDWFISNPDTKIKGLGEATVKLGFQNDVEKGHSYYAVAKPHVKSFPISIESLGFSAFVGSTDDGEYKHHYVRMSRLPEDKNLRAKSITPEQKEKLRQVAQTVCVESNKMEYVFLYDTAFQVCRVEFIAGIGSKDDVSKSDPDGWIMAEIERQYSKGRVLSSFIPKDNDRGNRAFYAVFEVDNNRDKREEVRMQLAHAA